MVAALDLGHTEELRMVIASPEPSAFPPGGTSVCSCVRAVHYVIDSTFSFLHTGCRHSLNGPPKLLLKLNFSCDDFGRGNLSRGDEMTRAALGAQIHMAAQYCVTYPGNHFPAKLNSHPEVFWCFCLLRALRPCGAPPCYDTVRRSLSNTGSSPWTSSLQNREPTELLL